MKEKGDENINSLNSQNLNTTNNSSNSTSSNNEIKTPTPIINPELQTIKSNNNNQKKEKPKEKEVEKFKMEIPNRQKMQYNEDMENLIDISNEIEMITDEEDEDSFIKEQYKSFNKLNKEKELLDLKKEENEKKEIDMKNDFAIRKANKEVLKARGIYRKRKKYQGNAKLMNREKFYKKEKERRKMIKEYEGKPEVYMGEATGIRRDLVRSTKIH